MDGSPQFTGFYSPLKALGLSVLLSVFAVVPLLPGFSNHLVYTAFFYTRLGYPILLVACAIMLLLAVGMLPMIVRGILHRPAIEISAESVRIWGIPKWREYPLSWVSQGARRQFGSLLGRCPDGKQFAIPLWLYRHPQEVIAHLNLAASEDASANG